MIHLFLCLSARRGRFEELIVYDGGEVGFLGCKDFSRVPAALVAHLDATHLHLHPEAEPERWHRRDFLLERLIILCT